jgi:hypothetical protein
MSGGYLPDGNDRAGEARRHCWSAAFQPIIKRHPNNPIFTAKEVPYPSVIACNAGVVKYQGQYVMVFRSGLFYACKTRGLCAYNVNSS